MANIIDDLTQTIHVEVDFFDDDEKERLLRYPTGHQIEELVRQGMTIKTAQFLTYYMFHKRRPGKQGFRNYYQLSSRIDHAARDLDDWVIVQNGSLVSAPDTTPQDRAITERIGEAIALSAAGQIHNIHDADWDRLPEYRGRGAFSTFDYERQVLSASDGNLVVQVEAKGTSPQNNNRLAMNIKKHRSDIAEKKEKIRHREASGSYPHPADLRYGVITALSMDEPLHCWLTDPPADQGPDPRRFRLLARLDFMFDWISFLSSRSQFAAAFATRLRTLMALKDPFVLADVPLYRGNGEPFSFIPAGLGGPPSLFAHLCRVTDGDAIGTLVKSSEGRLFFLGVRRHLFEKVSGQSFDEIMEYRDLGGSIRKTLDCVIPRGRARRMGIDHMDRRSNESSAYISFFAHGTLHYSQGGAVFGSVTPR